jgi:CBS domain-containing protein
MNAADIMARPVVSVTPETTITEAARLMLDHRIGGLPVLDRDGRLVGILSESDLLRRAETATERRRPRWLEFFAAPGRLARDYARAHARRVADAMTATVVSIAPDTPLDEIVRLMESRHVKRLPVVARDRLVGIVTRRDLVRALLATLPAPAPPRLVPDAEIRARIEAEIAKQPWARRAPIAVHVAHGEVELRGAITEERARAALRVIAENVPGVRRVRHRFVWDDGSSPAERRRDGQATAGSARGKTHRS